MDSNHLRKTFLEYFKKNGHVVVTSSSLIPDNDPSVLLTTAGMQQFKPYFLGTNDPVNDFGSPRLASVQKCFRTSDIEPVGDESHNTFFEMLGNFSINDYFKDEAIVFAWEFLTKRLHITEDRLWITIYAGDELVDRDREAEAVWRRFVPDARISAFGRESNWWGPAGKTGSCGPSSEIHYDRTAAPCERGAACLPNCPCNRFVELWNLVFTEFEKKRDGAFVPLAGKHIDTGMGLERLAMVVQATPTIFETDLLKPLVETLASRPEFGTLETPTENDRRLRIVADHLRAAIFLIADGVEFSNKTQGYVLRRITRRAIDQFQSLEIDFRSFVETVADMYHDAYPGLGQNQNHIIKKLNHELASYHKVLKADIASVYTKLRKRLDQPGEADEAMPPGPSARRLTADEAYQLYTTYGFSPERLKREGYTFDEAAFAEQLQKHQQASRAGLGTFHGGLADHEPNTIRGHTATHLLQQALRDVLGSQVMQKGSNITAERVRFDFTNSDKLTADQISQVERIVNEKIAADLPVVKKLMSLDEANALGAIGLFEEKYGEKVSVYLIGSDDPAAAYSKEFCGGPHVTYTGSIGSFKIMKEEASSAGVRRLKALVGESLDPKLKDQPLESL